MDDIKSFFRELLILKYEAPSMINREVKGGRGMSGLGPVRKCERNKLAWMKWMEVNGITCIREANSSGARFECCCSEGGRRDAAGDAAGDV